MVKKMNRTPAHVQFIKEADVVVENRLRQELSLLGRMVRAIQKMLDGVAPSTALSFLGAITEPVSLFRYGIVGLWDIVRGIVDHTLERRGTRISAGLITAGLATIGVLGIFSVIALGGIPAVAVGVGILATGYMKETRLLEKIVENRDVEKNNNGMFKKTLSELEKSARSHPIGTLELKKQLHVSNKKLQNLEKRVQQGNEKYYHQRRSFFSSLLILLGTAVIPVFPPLGIVMVVMGTIALAVSSAIYTKNMRKLEQNSNLPLVIEAKNKSNEINIQITYKPHVSLSFSKDAKRINRFGMFKPCPPKSSVELVTLNTPLKKTTLRH